MIDGGTEIGIDGGTDGGIDGGIDRGIDAGIEGGIGEGIDKGIDARIDGGTILIEEWNKYQMAEWSSNLSRNMYEYIMLFPASCPLL